VRTSKVVKGAVGVVSGGDVVEVVDVLGVVVDVVGVAASFPGEVVDEVGVAVDVLDVEVPSSAKAAVAAPAGEAAITNPTRAADPTARNRVRHDRCSAVASTRVVAANTSV
jgi:hypothetical protein